MLISPEISDEATIRSLPVLGRGMHSTAYEFNGNCLLLPKSTIVPIASLNVLNGICSEHLISLIHSYQTSSGKTVLVLPKGESMLNHFNKANSKRRIELIYQMMCGLHALHSAGFMHGDFKPANMLVVNDKVQLIDFEGSHRITDKKISHRILKTVWRLSSSPYITAPELANFTLHHHPVSISLAADIWSLGISIFELYEGIMPQELLGITTAKDMFARHEDIIKAITSIVTSIPMETINSIGISAARSLYQEQKDKTASYIPFGIGEIILSCLTLDPLQRPKISHLLRSEIFREFTRPVVYCKPNNSFIETEITSPVKLFPQEEYVMRCMASFTDNTSAMHIIASAITFSRPNMYNHYPPSIVDAKAIYSVLQRNNFWIY